MKTESILASFGKAVYSFFALFWPWICSSDIQETIKNTNCITLKVEYSSDYFTERQNNGLLLIWAGFFSGFKEGGWGTLKKDEISDGDYRFWKNENILATDKTAEVTTQCTYVYGNRTILFVPKRFIGKLEATVQAIILGFLVHIKQNLQAEEKLRQAVPEEAFLVDK